jgi:ubiquinone/menaquinone biosynthesis C-methylase UbiE
MNKTPNSQYNVAAANSLPVKVAAYQRRRMYERFLQECRVEPDDTILDVGVTSDRTYSSSNYLEAWYPYKSKITAAGIDDASFLEDDYPGMRFVQADGLNLPFTDGSFDVVHSSAVIEHVGSFQNQIRLIAECARVSRKAVFITTPNRWFPIEFHTVLPFVHWLPKSLFRSLMRLSGREFFAHERNLNLMTAEELRSAAIIASTSLSSSYVVKTQSLAGWPSNLLLIRYHCPSHGRHRGSN